MDIGSGVDVFDLFDDLFGGRITVHFDEGKVDSYFETCFFFLGDVDLAGGVITDQDGNKMGWVNGTFSFRFKLDNLLF